LEFPSSQAAFLIADALDGRDEGDGSTRHGAGEPATFFNPPTASLKALEFEATGA
jgi:hypothetical protein